MIGGVPDGIGEARRAVSSPRGREEENARAGDDDMATWFDKLLFLDGDVIFVSSSSFYKRLVCISRRCETVGLGRYEVSMDGLLLSNSLGDDLNGSRSQGKGQCWRKLERSSRR